MKRSILMLGVSLLLGTLIAAAPAMAQEENHSSETAAKAQEDAMQVVGPKERPEDVDRELTLPESAAQQGKESSSHGMDTANEAREKHKEFGQERAEESREMSDEHAEEVRERARERAEEAREQTHREKARKHRREQMREHNENRRNNQDLGQNRR